MDDDALRAAELRGYGRGYRTGVKFSRMAAAENKKWADQAVLKAADKIAALTARVAELEAALDAILESAGKNGRGRPAGKTMLRAHVALFSRKEAPDA